MYHNTKSATVLRTRNPSPEDRWQITDHRSQTTDDREQSTGFVTPRRDFGLRYYYDTTPRQAGAGYRDRGPKAECPRWAGWHLYLKEIKECLECHARHCSTSR